MNEFLENLKAEASANPTMAIAAVAGLLAAASKFLDATAHHKGATAFAKDAARRSKAAKK